MDHKQKSICCGARAKEEVWDMDKGPELVCEKCWKPFVGREDGVEEWLIWSIEHNAWWKAHHNGYTQIRAEAGLYTLKEALKILKSANLMLNDIPNEAMIKKEWELEK